MNARRVLISLPLAIIISTAGNANPPIGYIGLFAGDSHDSWCINGVGFYQASMWIWCLPGQNGMICAEFNVSYPANVIHSTTTYNPYIPPIIIPMPGGYSICFSECNWDWVWIFNQVLYVTDQTQTMIEIAPHDDVGVYQFANCEPGFPVEPCIKMTNLYINYEPDESVCSVTGIETNSWGAIKSLFR
jgi:hypothetical protein